MGGDRSPGLGRGGIALVARTTGISSSTIDRGLNELESGESAGAGHVLRAGGGREKSLQKNPTLLTDLEILVEPTASGETRKVHCVRPRRVCVPWPRNYGLSTTKSATNVDSDRRFNP